MNELSTILRWMWPARAMQVGNMPTCATNMVALPFASSSPTDPFAVELGSASILLAVVGMLPTSGFDLRCRIGTRKTDERTRSRRVMYTRGSANPRRSSE